MLGRRFLVPKGVLEVLLLGRITRLGEGVGGYFVRHSRQPPLAAHISADERATPRRQPTGPKDHDEQDRPGFGELHGLTVR